MSDKFVSLSTKSLKEVANWVDSNQDDPMAEAYDAACILIACLLGEDTEKWWMENQIQKSFYEIKKKQRGKILGLGWYMYWDAKERAYDARDVIGRAILYRARQESTLRETVSGPRPTLGQAPAGADSPPG